MALRGNLINFLLPKLIVFCLSWYFEYPILGLPFLLYGLWYGCAYAYLGVIPVDLNAYTLFGDRPTAPQNVPLLITLQRCDPEELKEHFAKKLTDDPNFEKLKYRFVECLGRFTHKWMTNFNARDHISIQKEEIESKSALMEEFGKLASLWWDDESPRWKIVIYPRYGEDQSAAILVFHHTILDGVSLAALGFSMMTCEGEPRIPQINNQIPLWKRFVAPFAYPFLRKDAISHLLTPQEDFYFQKNLALVGKRKIDVVKFDLEELKRIAKIRKSTVGVLITVALCKTLEKMSLEREGKCAKKFCVILPVGFRSVPQEGHSLPLGNHFHGIFPNIDMDAPDLFNHVHEKINAEKNGLPAYIRWRFMDDYLNRFITTQEVRDNIWNQDFPSATAACVSNVIGPRCQTYLLGKKVDTVCFAVPPWNNSVSGCSVMGWGDKINVAFATDEVYQINPQDVTAELRKVMEELSRE